MAYGDILYRRVNIIGYTGDLHHDPTVYFACAAHEHGFVKLKTVSINSVQSVKGLFWFGHITQAHYDYRNVGRDLVRESWSYNLTNVEPKDMGPMGAGMTAKRLQETYHQYEHWFEGQETPDRFTSIHVSRETFNAVSWRDADTLDILENSISRFSYVKPKYPGTTDNYIKYAT